MHSGFPFTYFDVGIIAGNNVAKNSNRSFIENTKLFLQYSTGMVNNKIMIVKNSPAWSSYETELQLVEDTTLVDFDKLTSLLRSTLHVV